MSRKRVWALMRGANLVLARDREHGEPPPRGHFTTDRPNRRFATDLTTVWTKREGWVAIMPTIDCGCRSILGLVVSKAQDALTVLSSVREALVTAFGAPSDVPDGLELRTDHGPQYTGDECAELLKHWNVEHAYAPIGRPTGNAVVERVIRTMKRNRSGCETGTTPTRSARARTMPALVQRALSPSSSRLENARGGPTGSVNIEHPALNQPEVRARSVLIRGEHYTATELGSSARRPR